DARARPAAVVLELRGRAGQRVRHVTDEIAFAAPVAACRLAVDVVPLRPTGREAADLIAAEADVPRLGDHLHALQYGVLLHGGKERRVAVEGGLAAERRGEIEAEAVDVKRL